MEIKDRLEKHLSMLCEEIGERPTGSEANKRAVEYVCGEFERAGLNVVKQEFDCIDWTQNGATLMLEGEEISVVPAPYSLSCSVHGEITCIHTLDELRSANIAGKIVLLCDTIAAEPLMPKSFIFWNPDEHKEIISLLENGNVQAVITVSLSPDSFVPVIEDGDFEVPCAVILSESLPKLSNGKVASLTLNTQRRPAKASNVIATFGSGKHKVCFSAHIDTKAGTSGALDNASGVAVLLALAEKLTEKKFPYRIEFVLFNGEDYYSTPGEMLYLSTYLPSPDEYVCAFNIDGVGARGQNLAYSFYECPEKLIESIKTVSERSNGFEQIEPWPQGDHTLFSYSGVPAISITSSGIFELSESVLHTDSDTLELIDVQKLETLVSFLLYSI